MKNLNKQIAISIIKGQLEKGNIPNAIGIAKGMEFQQINLVK